jgi:hypothetical protein
LKSHEFESITHLTRRCRIDQIVPPH